MKAMVRSYVSHFLLNSSLSGGWWSKYSSPPWTILDVLECCDLGSGHSYSCIHAFMRTSQRMVYLRLVNGDQSSLVYFPLDTHWIRMTHDT